MSAEAAQTTAAGHTGAFHGFGQHPEFCPGCRAERQQAAEQDERELAARATEGVAALAAAVQAACASVSAARGALASLVGVYDVELVEGPDAGDLAHELGVAARALRNAGRIAEHRSALEG